MLVSPTVTYKQSFIEDSAIAFLPMLRWLNRLEVIQKAAHILPSQEQDFGKDLLISELL